MNCHSLERRFALYIEEDLPEAERIELEEHLHGCSGCTAFVEDLSRSQMEFKALRSRLPDSDALSRVRESVVSRLEGLQPPSRFALSVERLFWGEFRNKTALASIALLLVLSGGALRLSMTEAPAVVDTRDVEIPSLPPTPMVIPEPKPSAPPQTVRSRRPRQKTRPLQVAPTEQVEKPQVAIRFLTDDPNIIIYLLVEEGGD